MPQFNSIYPRIRYLDTCGRHYSIHCSKPEFVHICCKNVYQQIYPPISVWVHPRHKSNNLVNHPSYIPMLLDNGHITVVVPIDGGSSSTRSVNMLNVHRHMSVSIIHIWLPTLSISFSHSISVIVCWFDYLVGFYFLTWLPLLLKLSYSIWRLVSVNIAIVIANNIDVVFNHFFSIYNWLFIKRYIATKNKWNHFGIPRLICMQWWTV